MRLPSVLYARNAAPPKVVPFQERMPLKLKPRVSGKGDNTTEVCCLYEMSIMFACFKEKDFNQSMCSKEIENFQKCYAVTMEDKKLRKERDARGIIAPGEKKLTPKQINTMLKRFPLH